MPNNRRFSNYRSLAGLMVLVIGMSLGPTRLAEAHGVPHRPYYVAPHGRDVGHCDDPRRPCQTIRYAIDHVHSKGAEVRVAAGEYTFEATNLDLLLSSLVRVKGGYSAGDLFTVQDAATHTTYLAGVPTRYRAKLRLQGFSLTQDRDGITEAPEAVAAPEGPTARTNCVAGMAGIYPCNGIDLLARIPLSGFSSQPFEASNIWGFMDLNTQREYALIGLNNGTAVVDVTNPESPVVVGTVPAPNSSWRELRVYQFFNQQQNRWNAYGYVVTEAGGAGMQIINLNNLPTSVSLAATYTGISRAHTIYLGNADFATGAPLTGNSAQAYINGSNLSGGAYRVVDLTNPTAPTLVTTPAAGAQYTHDGTSLTITDSRTAACAAGHNPCELFIDYNEESVDIWDVTNKAAPFRISSTSYPGVGYVHSGWWTADKRYLFIQDEFDEADSGTNTKVRTLNISNLAAPVVTTSWTGPTRAIDHNGYTKGNLYYMSNYQRGLTILDVTNPLMLSEVAFFDSYPAGNSANFNGAWGVYPYFPSGTIVVSDIEGGLFILRETAAPQTITGLSASSNSPQPQAAPITFSASVTAGTNVTYAWNFGDGTTGTGPAPTHSYATPGTYTVAVTATNTVSTQSQNLQVVVTAPPVAELLTFLPMLLGDPATQALPRSLPGGIIALMTLVVGLLTHSFTRRASTVQRLRQRLGRRSRS